MKEEFCIDCEALLNNHNSRSSRGKKKRCGTCYLTWKAVERKREGRL